MEYYAIKVIWYYLLLNIENEATLKLCNEKLYKYLYKLTELIHMYTIKLAFMSYFSLIYISLHFSTHTHAHAHIHKDIHAYTHIFVCVCVYMCEREKDLVCFIKSQILLIHEKIIIWPLIYFYS